MTTFIIATAISFAVFTFMCVFGGVLLIRAFAKDYWAMAFVGGIVCLVGALSATLAGANLVDRLAEFARYEVLAEQAIKVLDRHGVAETCKHINCQELLSKIEDPEDIPTSVEVGIK